MRAQSVLHNLFFGAALGAFAFPAAAEEYSNTTYAGIYSNYPYQDLGIYGSDHTVAQGGHTTVCGSWKVDNWISSGQNDEFRGADEYDLTVSYTHTFNETPMGPVVAEFTGAYYAFDFKGLNKAKDDAFDFHVDVARPITIGKVTVNPFLRLTHIGFVNGDNGLNFIRPGLRVSGPITERLSYALEGSVNLNQTQDQQVSRFQGDLNYNLGGGLNINGRLKLTEGVNEPMIGGGMSYTW